VFSQSVIEKLEHYVYFLQNPRNEEIFYVGKGSGNRVFQHLNCSVETDPDGHFKIPHLWPGQNPPATE